MKNKEVYKQAFKHVHYQKEINLNQRRIPKPLITLATSLIVLLSTFTVAYAFDVGGIQSKLDVWFHGEKRSLNDEFGIFYDEKEDKYLFYYQDNIVDVTHMFDKEKNCYLVINNGQKDIYFVMSYKTKIDEDNAISLLDDENREVYHGVKVKDIKDKFVRIK